MLRDFMDVAAVAATVLILGVLAFAAGVLAGSLH